VPYNAIISRTEAEGLIPTEVAGDVIKAAIQSSAALALSRRATRSSKLQRQPVLSVLPQAYWVAGDTGLKMPSDAAFEGLELNAEEIAVLIPIPEAVLDDASYDEWGELRDPIAQAIGVKLDAAIFSGTEKPASWPEAIVPAAILAANVNTIDATAAEGGVYTDIVETGDAVENDGYEVTGYVVKRALRSQLSRMRDTTGQPLSDVSSDSIGGLPVGYAPAGTLPATERDRRTVGPVRDRRPPGPDVQGARPGRDFRRHRQGHPQPRPAGLGGAACGRPLRLGGRHSGHAGRGRSRDALPVRRAPGDDPDASRHEEHEEGQLAGTPPGLRQQTRPRREPGASRAARRKPRIMAGGFATRGRACARVRPSIGGSP